MRCNRKVVAWFDQAMVIHSPYMIPYMQMCAQEGFVDLLKENIEYFKIDLCCEMLNLMKQEGIQKSCFDASYQFDYKINLEMKQLMKNYLLQAHRMLLKRKYALTKNKKVIK
jgi:hypothetical protein